MRSGRLVQLAVSVMLALPWAVHAAESDTATTAAIKKTLQERFADVEIIDVRPAPVAGLFEVYMGDSIVYADATGDYLMVGPLMDTRTRANLTANRLNERNAISFDTLPFGQAIKVVKGNGKRRMAVFSDPDCPYCKQLERTLANVTDVTVYTFLYPIESLHPDAPNKAHAIWCAKDPSATWLQWMQAGKAPPAAPPTCKENTVSALQSLGNKLHIGSTPTLFFASGRRISGAQSAADLEELLNAPATAAAAAKK